MLNFFDWLQNAISQLWNFVTNIVTNLIEMVNMLVNAQKTLDICSGYLPTFIGSFAIAYLAIRIVFMLVGRDSE